MAKKKENIKLKTLVSTLPEKPGVYRFYDKNDNLLYVGKAKNLKKRVSSYFTKHHDSGKTRVLVKKIVDIKPIVVENESDALLLENNLIKTHKPRYNVMLKDDKTYPWIVIRNEEFPRVHLTRNVIKDGSEYFGPYTSVKVVRTLLDMIRQLYPIRNCKYKLSEDNINRGKFKACLEYHLGNCLAPCEGKQSESDYLNNIEQIRNIVKGDLNSVLSYLKNLMQEFAENYKFEDAENMRQKISLIENYKAKSTIVNPKIHNMDVFGMVEDKQTAYINYLKIANGAIIQAHSIEIKKRIEEDTAELLSTGIHEIRTKLNSTSTTCLVPIKPAFGIKSLDFLIPQRGDKKHLLDLSMRNAKYFMLDKHKQIEHTNPERHTKRILETLKTDLHLTEEPVHIECFDNSNIQGHYPVAACVVFKNAKPSKKDYRHFHIKTVEGPDDYASMKEIIMRRYTRLTEENQSLPQLIIIDGGKGQLRAAVEGLEAIGLRGKIAIIGIAKRLEEIFFPDDSVPLYLDKNSESLKVIQHARDEAHRFGITFHRNQRSKDFIKSELDNITGIGGKTTETLLKVFGSLKKIKAANEAEIAKHIGKAKAQLIMEYFKTNNT
ncbi:MAG: excinuclease ABC subunit UvrC [Bacteroidota bacterium]|nr:excinuclease ABC subunit UvrC [Bacteroidota bacterium]